MTAEAEQLEIYRKRLDKAARKLQKEAISIICEGGHDPEGRNRGRDTKKKLYAKQIVQRGFMLLERAYELEYFSKDVLRLQGMIAYPEKFKVSATHRCKAITMMATKRINHDLPQTEIAKIAKVTTKTLNDWKKSPRYRDLKEMLWGLQNKQRGIMRCAHSNQSTSI